MMGSRSDNLISDHLSMLAMKDKSLINVPSIENNLIRKTASFCSAPTLGPLNWPASTKTHDPLGNHFTLRGGEKHPFDSPGPVYNCRIPSTPYDWQGESLATHPKSAEGRERRFWQNKTAVNIPAEKRNFHLGRSVTTAPRRALGEFNKSGGKPGREAMLTFAAPIEKSPGPSDYRPNTADPLVGRNSSTRTAPRMVPHTNHSRKTLKHHHQVTAAEKIRNQKLADDMDPEILRALLQRFVDHLQYSQNNLESLLAMYDTDDSGALSITELEYAVADMNIKMSHMEVHSLICYLDQVRPAREPIRATLNSIRTRSSPKSIPAHRIHCRIDPGRMPHLLLRCII
jgi:hypothetical protein